MRTSLGVILLLCLAAPVGASPDSFVLVRHAEALAYGEDPGLSEAGRARALDLVRCLADSGIDHVFSSTYQRAVETARPVADALGLAVELYDPRDLPGLVERLDEMEGHCLVVGHSNTTYEMVELLGGDPGPQFDHTTEYDRLYVLTREMDGSSPTLLLRYGRP